jgi:hypothetical protein
MKVHFAQKYMLNKILRSRESFICLSPPDFFSGLSDQSNAGGDKQFFRLLLSISLVLFSFSLNAFAQDTANNEAAKKEKNKYVIGFIPSSADNIFGIAIGLIGSEASCNTPNNKYSHGLNFQIFGQGFIQVYYAFNPPFKQAYTSNLIQNEIIQIDSSIKRVVHNGLIVSPFGTFTDQVNGVSISGFMSAGKKINGVSVNLLWNLYYKIDGLSMGAFNSSLEINGVQIGVINKTIDLKGIQLGLWNRNAKRSLPLINWNFRD